MRIIARTVDRSRVKAPSPFDSWFEVDVFLRIIGRGYRVIPQFEIAGYYIDLVVEGMQGRLAVECDGDKWHGADRYEEDMGRQRMLRRCGLRFWRIRGSTFYRDPEASLEGLWETLDSLKIYPTSQNEDDATDSAQGERMKEEPESGPEIEKEHVSKDEERAAGFLLWPLSETKRAEKGPKRHDAGQEYAVLIVGGERLCLHLDDEFKGRREQYD